MGLVAFWPCFCVYECFGLPRPQHHQAKATHQMYVCVCMCMCIYIYMYSTPPPVIHTFSACFVFFLSWHCVFLLFVRDLFSLSQRVDLCFLSFFISGCLSFVYIAPVETGTNRYKSVQVVPAPGPGTKNQEPRLQGKTSLQSWFLVLGSRGGAGTTCTVL